MLDTFNSAKYPVEFVVGADSDNVARPRFEGFFIRNTGRPGDQVAVTPAVRDAVAALDHSQFADLDQLARERILALPTREDGLVHLQHLATKVLRRLDA